MNKRVNYRESASSDGSLTPHLFNPIAERVRNYCKQQNISVSKFVEECISAHLDTLEREALNNMTKEMLIELLMTKNN